MASEVDICNLALGNLGDAANLQSISPPDGSAQADHCARFYPIARDALLEMHHWGFASKRVALAQLANPVTQWTYCYAQPTDLIDTIAVLDPASTDDTSAGIPSPVGMWYETPMVNAGSYTPQPYTLEAAADGSDVLYTNQANALLRYVARITDTSKFSPLFVRVLAASLSSMLAGPVIKGEAGLAAAARWEMIAFGRDGKSGLFGRAAEADANGQRSTARDRPSVSWIAGR